VTLILRLVQKQRAGQEPEARKQGPTARILRMGQRRETAERERTAEPPSTTAPDGMISASRRCITRGESHDGGAGELRYRASTQRLLRRYMVKSAVIHEIRECTRLDDDDNRAATL
jgi:hypothetical protein